MGPPATSHPRPMFARHVSQILRGADRRARHRYRITKPVSLSVIIDGTEHSGRLYDVSLDGARLTFAQHVEPSGDFQIQHPVTGPITVRRAWATRRTIGITFDSREAATSLCVHCLKMLVPSTRLALVR